MLLFLSSLIIPAAINAQCLTVGVNGCRVCNTPIASVSPATVGSCHISSDVSRMTPALVGSFDLVSFAEQWVVYAKNNIPASRWSTLCPLTVSERTDISNAMYLLGYNAWNGDYTYYDQINARGYFKRLGCFVAASYNHSGITIAQHEIWEKSRMSWNLWNKRTSLQAVYGKVSQYLVDTDSRFVSAVGGVVSAQRGTSLFPSPVHQLAYYVYGISWAYRFAGNLIPVVKEHYTYFYWTFLPFSSLSTTQKSQYLKYQKGLIATLPRKRQSTSNAVFSIPILLSTCPSASPYVTTGCLAGVASQCQIVGTAKCVESFKSSIPLAYRSSAKEALAAVCPHVTSSYPVLCRASRTSW